MKTYSMKHPFDEEDSLETSSLSDEEITPDFFRNCRTHMPDKSSQLSELEDSEMSAKPFFWDGINTPFREAVSIFQTYHKLSMTKLSA